DHINMQLLGAAAVGTLFFIVDTLGVDVVDKRDPRTRATTAPTHLFAGLRDVIAGASRRPLRPTFQSDPVEVKKYVDFLGIHVQSLYDTYLEAMAAATKLIQAKQPDWRPLMLAPNVSALPRSDRLRLP